MRLYAVTCLIFTATLLLAGCGPTVQQVDYAQPLLMPEDAHPAPIKFSGIDLILPVGMDIGYENAAGDFCIDPNYPVNRNVLKKAIDHDYLAETFHDALEASGYDVVGSLKLAYEREDEQDRAEYSVKGKVVDVELIMCNNFRNVLNPWSATHHPGNSGKMYVAIDWSLYDALRRHVVFKTRTEGYTDRNIPNQEGLALMFQDAFEMAAHNLASNQDFFNIIVNGVKPPKPAPGTRQDRDEERWQSRPRKFDARESVTLAPAPLSRQPFKRDAKNNRHVAVMIQKFGHGSGFFISRQGHILTNAHVVGDSRRIRIVTADKKKKLVAEVLRRDKARDVALLKLEEIPEDFEIVTLPVRTAWPEVSEDVYLIGTPKDYRSLQDTITKGIVSAHRMQMKFLGTRQNFIQADVETHGGNSGGPLLDENGNIIGLAVGGIDNGGAGIGLNYFIPIGEALDVLDIAYTAAPGAGPVPLKTPKEEKIYEETEVYNIPEE